MKELTIEEKAKRYDEAIEELRTMMPNWENLSYNGKTFLQDLVHIIPELKESEDERMMNSLHSWMKEFGGAEEYTEKVYQWIKGLLENTKKQEWSEEDEKMLGKCIDAASSYYSPEEKQSMKDWLRTLKDRVQPQNTITDKEIARAKKEAYNDALDKIEYHSGEPTFDDGWSAAILYLKKKNAQPQNTWKPSDEQMEALDDFIYAICPNSKKYRAVVKSLYQDLKKLRGE